MTKTSTNQLFTDLVLFEILQGIMSHIADAGSFTCCDDVKKARKKDRTPKRTELLGTQTVL